MKSEENKLEEFQVLTEEQILELPVEVKENVVFLTEKLGASELVTLNPMVVELLEIRKMNEELILMPKNLDGDFNKENIKDYKALKSKIRSFNSKIKSSAKKLKIEPAKITKGIIAIEKTFLNENKIVQDSAAEKFALYEADVIEKARIAKEKKDKALTDKIAEEKAIAEKANLNLNKTVIYNKVKYELINKKYSEDVSDAVLNANEAKLKEMRNELLLNSYDEFIKGNDISILDENVQSELKDYFISSKNKALNSIDARVKAIETEKENTILSAKNETIKETVEETTKAFTESYSQRPIQPIESIEVVEDVVKSGPSIPPPPRFETIEACINNIEWCEYFDENNQPLNTNVAWIRLKELIKINKADDNS